MTRIKLVRAGQQLFGTHPRSGALLIATLVEPFSTGHDGILPSRIFPVTRTPAASERPFAPSPAVAPAFPASVGTGSHLWVG